MFSANFKAYMQSFGIICSNEIIHDGNIHRFHVEGDRAASKNGWYVLHDLGNGLMAGSFGSWKLGVKERWCNCDDDKVTPQARQAIVKIHKKIDYEIKEKQNIAKEKASFILARATKQSHAYLINKGIQQTGLVYKNCLTVPIYDQNKELTNLQFITENGSKRFLAGGQIKGCYYVIGDLQGKIQICESISTGLSINEATKCAVVIAFSANNLLTVAKLIKSKYPDKEIIICADNDQWRIPNTGIIKATEAAKAVRGKVATPRFENKEGKPTDFNDLMKLEGLEEVSRQLTGNAIEPEETAQEAAVRLAKLPDLKYDQIREEEAKKLGVRLATLDSEVDKLREQTETSESSKLIDEIEEWSEPVNGNEIAKEVEQIIKEHIILSDEFSFAATIWIIGTYCFDAFSVFPSLLITSATMRCGKSTLLRILHALAHKALTTSNITPAVIFRVIELLKPTLLIDELDSFGNHNEELRNIINSSHTKDTAFVFRMTGDGKNLEPQRFSTWSPVCIGMIGKPKPTIIDRSIIISLKRKLLKDKTKKLKIDIIKQLEPIRQKLKRWANDNFSAIKSLIDSEGLVLPSYGNDRAVDNWTPLFAIAEILGSEWVQKLKVAYQQLNSVEDEETITTMLLKDIRNIFEEINSNKIHSQHLINKLLGLTELGWGEIRQGKGITPSWLAKTLKHFGITSKQIRVNEINKNGYLLTDFEDAFNRYLPEPPIQNSTTLQASTGKASSGFQNSTEANGVEFQKPLKASNGKACRVVESQNGVNGETDNKKEVFIV